MHSLRIARGALGVCLLAGLLPASSPADGTGPGPAYVKDLLLARQRRGGALPESRFAPAARPAADHAAVCANQGDEHWVGGFHVSGLDGPVSRLHVHAGGLHAGGGFQQAGTTHLNYVARWDGSDWLPLGAGMDDWVTALGSFRGELVAGGDFRQAGNRAAESIARWDGSAWQPLGEGLQGDDTAWVTALAVHDGDLYAGGYFETAGGVPAPNVARWDGTAWHAVGSGLNSSVLALVVWNGSLYAAGTFTASGDQGENLFHVARLANGEWKPVGDGLNNWVLTLAVHDGELVAGGYFTGSALTAAARVARWNGSRWESVGGGLDDAVWHLEDIDGILWAGGTFPDHVATYIGGFWFSRQANTSDIVVAVENTGEGAVIGGYFTFAGETPAGYVLREHLDTWVPMQTSQGQGLSGTVWDIMRWEDGIVAAGDFVVAGGKVVRYVARWDGAEWHDIGGGLDGLGARSLGIYNGDLVVSGYFEHAGGNEALGVARWDGATWRAMGDGINGAAQSMVVYKGRLYAGGNFTRSGPRWLGWVGRFDGGIWQGLDDGVRRDVYDLEVYDGMLYVAGNFREVPGYEGIQFLGAWDGTAWHRVGDLGGPVGSLAVHGNDLIVSGTFSEIGGAPMRAIARFDGEAWSPLGEGIAYGIYAMTGFGGDLVAAGKFTDAGGGYVNRIARWDGEGWCGLGSGVNDNVYTLEAVDDALYIGGSLTQAGGRPSSFLALWNPEGTPVRLLGFAAGREGGAAIVTWSIAGESSDHVGFRLHREDRGGERVPVSGAVYAGSTRYRVRDDGAPAGRTAYWLEELLRNGESVWHGPAPLDGAVPVLALAGGRPNPFRAGTLLSGTNPRAGRVTLRVFDANGREVARPLEATLPAGDFETAWDGAGFAGSPLAAGVYYLRLDTPGGTATRKLVRVP